MPLTETAARLRTLWHEIAAAARGIAPSAGVPELNGRQSQRLRDELQACLEERDGEIAARARAAQAGRVYLSLSAEGRERFLRTVASFDADRKRIDDLAAQMRDAAEPAQRRRIEASLRRALEPPRVQLLRRFNSLPEGVKFLVDLRADLLDLASDDVDLRALERDLKDLLASWFDVGFLELRRITWDSPAALLERLANYEAVHEMRGWPDIKNRLDADRRCFAFFHPLMPAEPLIFIEVALVDELSGEIAALLDQRAPLGMAVTASHAIFYSISNCQRGLAGISFGYALIKRVVDVLSSELRSLKTFSTLSPIPGFRAWLEHADEKAAGDNSPHTLRAMLAKRSWYRDPEAAEALREPLMRLCAHYLLEERRPGTNRALDPVAHFHLSNGAQVERINWLGDLSSRGMRESAGMMVNYLYRLDQIDENHQAYAERGEIAASNAVRRLRKR
ncbi:malonyl-CoA decarboxylase [bacterium]|nr:MAG: malonyl-CoA decarboxylase [bacterium]